MSDEPTPPSVTEKAEDSAASKPALSEVRPAFAQRARASVTAYFRELLTDIVDALRKPSGAFTFAMFAVLVGVTFMIHWRNPLGPGQDYHYHLMTAAMHGRSATQPLAAIYYRLSPLDANTLVYFVSWPFQQFFDPMRAFQLTLTCLYFIGYPLGCAYALHRMRRAPWGALIAFVIAYTKAWSMNGFIPFITASTFYVIGVAEFEALFERYDSKPMRAMIGGAIATTLCFMGHGHVYAWMTLNLALMTVFAMRKAFAIGMRTDAREALKRTWDVAWRSLATIGPSLALFGAWYLRTHYGQAAAHSNTALRTTDTGIEYKLTTFWQYFVHIRGPEEYNWLGVITMAVLVVWLLGPRDEERPRNAEGVFLLSILSFMVLPQTVNEQSIASRQVDLAQWMMPMIVFPAAAARVRKAVNGVRLISLREWAAVLCLFVFSLLRVQRIGEAVHEHYAQELAPIAQLAPACRAAATRRPFSIMAYASMKHESTILHSPSFHQVHETLAALCAVETPVYDTTVYPHNLLPLRYRSTMPAPVTIIENNQNWYQWPGLWEKFDLVLTAGWTPTPADTAVLEPLAVPVATAGTFTLYRRR